MSSSISGASQSSHNSVGREGSAEPAKAVGVAPGGIEASPLVASDTAEAFTKGGESPTSEKFPATLAAAPAAAPAASLEEVAATTVKSVERTSTLELNLEDPGVFNALVKTALDRYYKVPFPGEEAKGPGELNRYLHGATHVSRVACNTEFFAKFSEHVMGETPLTGKQMALLKLAAIYHDSANLDDGTRVSGDIKNRTAEDKFLHEAGHVQQFLDDMIEAGVDPNDPDLRDAAFAIELKDIPDPLDPDAKLVCLREGSEGNYRYTTTVKEFINSQVRAEQHAEPYESPESCTDYLRENMSRQQRFLHDGDCLDVRRIRPIFYKEELCLHEQVKGTEKESLLDRAIARHDKFIQRIGDDFSLKAERSKRHIACENSENPYLFIQEKLQEHYLMEAVKLAGSMGKDMPSRDLLLKDLSMEDLYVCDPEKIKEQLLEKGSGVAEAELKAITDETVHCRLIDTSESFHDEVAVLQKNQEILKGLDVSFSEPEAISALCEVLGVPAEKSTKIVTILRDAHILTEKHVKLYEELDKDQRSAINERLSQIRADVSPAEILKALKMQQLRCYVKTHGKSPISEDGTPFIWRPSTLISQNAHPSIFYKGRIGLIFKDMGIYSYKKNVGSSDMSTKVSDYQPTKGSKKDKGESLPLKLEEMTQRQKGEVEDRGLGLIGSSKLTHNEVLGTYTQESVQGLMISRKTLNEATKLDKDQKKQLRADYEEACAISAALGRTVPLLCYNPEHGFTEISHSQIASLLSQEEQSKVKNTLHETFLSQLGTQGISVQGYGINSGGDELVTLAQIVVDGVIEEDLQWHCANDTISLPATLEISNEEIIVFLETHFPSFQKSNFSETVQADKTTYRVAVETHDGGHFGHVQEVEIDITPEGEKKIKISTRLSIEDSDVESPTYRDESTSGYKAIQQDREGVKQNVADFLQALISREKREVEIAKRRQELVEQVRTPSLRQHSRRAEEYEMHGGGTAIQYCFDLVEPTDLYCTVYKDEKTAQEAFVFKVKTDRPIPEGYESLVDEPQTLAEQTSLYRQVAVNYCETLVSTLNQRLSSEHQFPFKQMVLRQSQESGNNKLYLEIIPKEGQSKATCLAYMNDHLLHPEGSPVKDKAEKFPQSPQDHLFVEVYMPALEAFIEQLSG
ncbi:MAG: hypothetical protein VW378_07390 [bacterium]